MPSPDHDPLDLDDLEGRPRTAGGGGGSTINLREYLQGLRRRWKLVALVTVLVLLAAVVHYVITPPVYHAQTILQIERRSLNPLSSTQTPWLENWWNMEYYPTQYQLLQSRGLAERVVRSLRLMEDSRFAPATTASSPEDAGAAQDRAALGRVAQRLQGGLSVDPVRNTQLVRLSYQSSSPELAARIVNGFAQAFIEWGIDDRSGLVVKASSFLGQQIEDLKQEIGDKEAELQAFSRTEDVLNFNPESNVTYQRLQALNDQYMNAKRTRIEKEAAYQELQAQPRQTVADAESSGLVSEMAKELNQLEREYETKLQIYKPDFPAMQELQAQIDSGRERLQELIDREARRALDSAYAEFQTALRQENALSNEIDDLKNQALDQSSSAVKFSNLQVEVETRRELLDELLRRQSETEVAARLQSNRESNIRIVDEALVPGAPSRPSLRNNLTAGLAAGLFLGMGLALGLQWLDRTIKRPEEIERLLGLPVLATVPDLSDDPVQGSAYREYGYGKRSGTARAGGRGGLRVNAKTSESAPVEMVPHTRPRLAVSETYRALRTALLLSTAEGLDTVAVTSAGAGEGKTVTSTNLAVVLAQLGKRVLIVDADLRKPRLHKVFGTSNRKGLVSFLTGTHDLDAIVQDTHVSHLSVCTSGPIPPNPSELLSSARMEDLVQAVRSRFDFVVFDTPPVLPVTDAILMGALSRGVVLCLRAGHVAREDARACLERLERADVKVLGAVLNGFRRRESGAGKNYSHYYEAYVADGPGEESRTTAS